MTALFVRSAKKLSEIQPSYPTMQMQPARAEPASSQPRRMEAWETTVAEVPRSGPEPILPDSDEEDNVSTRPLSNIAEDGDPANRAGYVATQYAAQQAAEPNSDPYVRQAPLRQTPLQYWHPPSEQNEDSEWGARWNLRIVNISGEDVGRR